MEKTKIDSQIWASIQVGLSDLLISESFSNIKLNSPVDDTTEIIYHYTTPEKFLSIVQNQSFYFTNINYLNDRKEFLHGVDLILKVIDRFSRDHPYAIIFEKIKNNINYIQRTSRYIACFSCNGDLLSQWRAYSNQGRGISIGFDRRSLLRFDDGHLSGMYITYNEGSQLEIIEEIINLQLNYFSEIHDLFDWEEYGYESLVATSMLDFLEDIISVFKHPSFSEEKEYRLEYKIDNKINTLEGSNIKFRASENLIIPYVNLRYYNVSEIDRHNNIKPIKFLPIKEIIVGPSLEFEPNAQSLNILMQQLGYKDVKIAQSKIPYRI